VTVDAVVFDVDGTLLDTMSSMPRVYVETIRDLSGPKLTCDEVVAAWNLGPTHVVLTHFLGRAATRRDLEAFYEHVASLAQVTKPFLGVPELLRSLRQQGRLLGIYTSATHRTATLMLARSGLIGHFTVLVSGDQVTNPKPAPDGLLAACRVLRIPASAAAYVGDTEADMLCAKTAGALPVFACWSSQIDSVPDIAQAARHPDDVVHELAIGCRQ
jgi:HAD superfamily hydrolase (TIGR01549 family)